MQNYATSKNYIEDQCDTYLHIDPSSIILHLYDPNTETPRSSSEWWVRHLVSTCQVQIYSQLFAQAVGVGDDVGVAVGFAVVGAAVVGVLLELKVGVNKQVSSQFAVYQGLHAPL